MTERDKALAAVASGLATVLGIGLIVAAVALHWGPLGTVAAQAVLFVAIIGSVLWLPHWMAQRIQRRNDLNRQRE